MLHGSLFVVSGINLKEVVNEEMQCEICRKENKKVKIDTVRCKNEVFCYWNRVRKAHFSNDLSDQVPMIDTGSRHTKIFM